MSRLVRRNDTLVGNTTTTAENFGLGSIAVNIWNVKIATAGAVTTGTFDIAVSYEGITGFDSVGTIDATSGDLAYELSNVAGITGIQLTPSTYDGTSYSYNITGKDQA
jgi:hypothetical protein